MNWDMGCFKTLNGIFGKRGSMLNIRELKGDSELCRGLAGRGCSFVAQNLNQDVFLCLKVSSKSHAASCLFLVMLFDILSVTPSMFFPFLTLCVSTHLQL